MDYIHFFARSSRNNEAVEISSESTDLAEVLETFERFLRGAGYVFEGKITIINDIFIKEPTE